MSVKRKQTDLSRHALEREGAQDHRIIHPVIPPPGCDLLHENIVQESGVERDPRKHRGTLSKSTVITECGPRSRCVLHRQVYE